MDQTNEGSSKEFVDAGAAESTQYIHRVHLLGLEPDTTYFYQVGSSDGLSAVFGFKTVASGENAWPLRVATYGDLGVVNPRSLTWLQEEAHQGMYDAIIHVGDFAYNMD